MFRRSHQTTPGVLLARFFASSVLILTAPIALAESQAKAMPSPTAASSSALPSVNRPSASSANWHIEKSPYYKRKWGVDIVSIRLVSSGAMLRFSYRIVDGEKAKPLNDKRWNPFLVDETTGAKLGVPEMDKVGKLRQTGPAEEGRVYWVVFGNPNHLVQRGGLVDVVIGDFRAEGIVVE